MSEPLFCLFFSFKGGVGRTSALMNTARSLAKKKKRVLVLDLDLAAPGIDIFDVVYQNGDVDRFSWPSYNPVKYYAYKNGLSEYSNENERKLHAAVKEQELSENYSSILRDKYGAGAPLGFVEYALRYCKHRFGNEYVPGVVYPEAENKIDIPLDYPSELSDEDEWGVRRYLFKLPTRNSDDGDILVMRAGNYDGDNLNLEIVGTDGKPEQEPYLKGSYDDRQNRLDVRALAYPYDLDTGKLIKDKENERNSNNTVDENQTSGAEGVSLNNNSNSDRPDQEHRSNAEHTEDDQEKVKDTAEPEFIQHLKNQISKLDVDYVLIDGRPGRDNISTLALDWLCSAVVLVFNFNPWNLLGVQQIYRYLHGTDNNPKPRRKTNPPPITILLATPIPSFAPNSHLYSGQHARIQKDMSNAVNTGAEGKRRLVEIPYADQLLLRDVLISDFAPDDVACDRYNELASLIIEQNQGDITNQIRAARETTGVEAQKTAFDSVINDHPGSVELLYEYGEFLLEHGEVNDAIAQFSRALEACAGNKALKGNDAFERVIHVGLNRAIQSKYQKLRSLLNKGREFSDFEEFEKLLNEMNQRTLKIQTFIMEAGGNDYEKTPSGARLLWQTGVQCMSIAKGIQFLKRLRPFVPQNGIKGESGHSQNSPTGVFAKPIIEWLAMAKMDFDKSLLTLPKSADMEQDLGELNWLIAMSSETPDETAYEKAIKNYKEAVKLKAESGEARLELGRYVLSRAIRSNGVAKPLAERNLPYFVWPDNVDSSGWLENRKTSEGLVLDPNGIQEAKDLFDSADRQLANDFFLPFHRGLAAFAEFVILRSRPKSEDNSENRKQSIELIQAIRRGIDGFSGATILRPQYSPAYLYGALLEFELAELLQSANLQDSAVQTGLKIGIRERRAFYKLEHFIDLELEQLLNRACDRNFITLRLVDTVVNEKFGNLATMPNKSERKPFFFDPEDIDAILVSDETAIRFEFLSLMEMLSGMPPLSEILYPNLPTGNYADYVSMMAKHHSPEK